ncbi:sugar phosphate isomerase/epimerase family protein [Bryobacter aggregatus]|uniref:sugar phosphate isomerase/epimerase family protein n=1 Tax=Bryobacter aggregatus TaxID=360054 RepID=UPI0004E13B68|nr:sugar phosphate isomerase/epimerase family protein [Bryobacter aggregatus]
MTRRQLLSLSALLPVLPNAAKGQNGKFKISLAEWSFHKTIQSRLLTNLDFPQVAREHYGIGGLEFVNTLWGSPTQSYLARLKSNMKKFSVEGVLIMCDGEGMMGHTDRAERLKSAALHQKWVDYAAELGCHAIRMNMHTNQEAKTESEIAVLLERCQESFTRICEYAQASKINILIENHGGVSSNPDVLLRLMKMVNRPNFGTLPDFGNFPKETDKYLAVEKLMQFAKGVSFKCWDFGADGKETTLDMDRMMGIVSRAGYRGWVGIEYEGERLTEFQGVQAARRFLDTYAA